MKPPRDATLERFEAELATAGEAEYELTLFVSGASDLAARAVANAKHLCDVHLRDRYRLAVVDVHEDPATVLESQVLATPTLVKNLPLPVRRVVGDLSRTEKVVAALGLPRVDAAPRDRG